MKTLKCLCAVFTAVFVFSLAFVSCSDPTNPNPNPNPNPSPQPPSSATVTYKALAEDLEKLEDGSPERPTIIVLDAIIISNAPDPRPASAKGWLTVNNIIAAAEKYVIIDLSACSFENNTVSGSYNPTINDMNVLNYNDYIKGVILPSGVVTIGDYAFYGCEYLTSVSISTRVTTIGNQAFYNCDSLSSITIPASVKTLGSSAFYGCSGLTNITIPEGVERIEYGTFDNCTNLTSITFPASVTNIRASSFSGCENLSGITVNVGNTVYQSIDGVLYSKDKSTLLRYPVRKNGATYTIPEGVTTVGSSAFYGCSGLANITIPAGVETIWSSTFSGCTGLANITIPTSVTTVGSFAFSGCTGLTDIIIPASVIHIEDYAFYNCSGLTSITFPMDYRIGDYAFDGCVNITSIAISEGVETIQGDGAFYDFPGLTSITIPASVKSIRGYDSEVPAFLMLENLSDITVNPGNTVYQSIDGVLYSKDKSTLVVYPAGKSGTSYTIPEGVTTIEDYAFFGCFGLTSIRFEEAGVTLGNDLFGFFSRTLIVYTESVTSLKQAYSAGGAGIYTGSIPNGGWTKVNG